MLADDQTVELPGVEGILLYRDFSDASIFYYCSTRPSVVRKNGDYQFAIVLYDRPRDDSAGMLSFIVDLKPDPAMMKKATDLIHAKTPGAQFVPMPWTAGTVATAIIGGAPVSGVPSLLGDNSAALSVGLTIDQYVLLKNSGQNPQAPPISIVYSLSYQAFRPQYRFSVEFDETRFREWVQKKTSVDLLVISFEKVETFEDLKQSGVIRVVSENETGETPPAAFQRAFLRSMQSLLDPAPRFAPPPGATGSTWLMGFSSSEVRDIQNISRRLDRNMKISGAVARKLYIQGVLGGLNEALAARPWITLPTNNPFIQKLTVRCYGAFDAPPLVAANVRICTRSLAVPSERVFDKARTAEWPVEFTHLPGADSALTYQCVSYFDGNREKSVSRPIEIQPEQVFLDILPSEFYAYRLYSVSVAKDFPWDLLQSIKLELKGPASLAFKPGFLTLGPSARSATISAFAPQPVNLDDVEFTATFQPRSTSSFKLDGLPAGATIFLNPFLRREVRFEASKDFDWRTWSSIEVMVVPSDANPQLWADGGDSFELTKSAPSHRFEYWYTDSRRLTCKRQFISGDPDGQPTADVPFEASEAHVTISNPNIPVVSAEQGGRR